jgi:hypothetical protein
MAEEVALRLVLHAAAGIVTDETPELVRGLPYSCAKASWEGAHRQPCRRSPGDRWFVDETYLRSTGNGLTSTGPSTSAARSLTSCCRPGDTWPPPGDAQSARPQGPVPEILRGEMRVTKPAG